MEKGSSKLFWSAQHQAVGLREIGGSNPSRINSPDFKITERKFCLCNDIRKWLDFKSSRIRTVNPVSQISSMFISSLWDVEEPPHYSRRVGDEVPGVVAVLVSPAGLAVRCMRPPKQKQP